MQIMEFKVRIMHTNVKHGMFTKILNLGELKGYIDTLRNLHPQEGVQGHVGFREVEKVRYKTQLKLQDRNKLIEECQELINKITDELDEFNANQNIEEMEVTVRI